MQNTLYITFQKNASSIVSINGINALLIYIHCG